MLNFGLDHGSVCLDGFGRVCVDDRCDRDELHPAHEVVGGSRRWSASRRAWIGSRDHEAAARTKSRRWKERPWMANCSDALREATFRSVSLVEPRNFARVLSCVENDYGSCCSRSVRRHLAQLRFEQRIVRLDFRGNVHAYLLAGSRLIADPELVHEQVTTLYEAV